MAQPFDAGAAPFNRLSPEEVGIVRNALDIGDSRPGETQSSPATALRRACSLSSRVASRNATVMTSWRCAARAIRSTAERSCRAKFQRLRRPRGDASEPPAPRPDPQAHQSKRSLRVVFLSRHRAQARSRFARGGGGAVRPAHGRARRRSLAARRRIHRRDGFNSARGREDAGAQCLCAVRARRRTDRRPHAQRSRQCGDRQSAAHRHSRRAARKSSRWVQSRRTISFRLRCSG